MLSLCCCVCLVEFLAAGALSPDWAANNTALRYLLLSNNSLTGFIPDSWSRLMANAVAVDLSNNRLWGFLGLSWANDTRNASQPWSLNSTKLR